MQALNKFKTEFDDIVRQSRDQKNAIGGSHVAWLMMIVGVAVTGTMTYSLTHEGMKSSALWQAWVDFAAFLPVGLLEGSAIALVYGKHHWFKSTEQRRLAEIAGWCIWVLLALTSVAHFALGKQPTGTAKAAMDFYAAYILPLSIVAAPMLWKRLYDAAPESKIRRLRWKPTPRSGQSWLNFRCYRMRSCLARYVGRRKARMWLMRRKPCSDKAALTRLPNSWK